MHRVAQLEHPHRRADHAGHRARPSRWWWHGSSVHAVAAGERASRPRPASSPAPRAASRRSGRRAAARTRGPSRSAARRAGTRPAPGRAPPQAGRTSTSSAPAVSILLDRGGVAAARRGSASTRASVRLDCPARPRRTPVDLARPAPPGRRARRRTAAAPAATTRGRPVQQASCGRLRDEGDGVPGGGRVGQEDRRAGRRAAPSACRRGSCGSSLRCAHSDTTTASSRPSSRPSARGVDERRRELGGRVGVGAVTEHDVEQQHRAARVGGLGRDPVERGCAGRSSGARGPG